LPESQATGQGSASDNSITSGEEEHTARVLSFDFISLSLALELARCFWLLLRLLPPAACHSAQQTEHTEHASACGRCCCVCHCFCHCARLPLWPLLRLPLLRLPLWPLRLPLLLLRLPLRAFAAAAAAAVRPAVVLNPSVHVLLLSLLTMFLLLMMNVRNSSPKKAGLAPEFWTGSQ
jgi:hypothetical protein